MAIFGIFGGIEIYVFGETDVIDGANVFVRLWEPYAGLTNEPSGSDSGTAELGICSCLVL